MEENITNGKCCDHKWCSNRKCIIISSITLIAIAFCIGFFMGKNWVNDFRGQSRDENILDRIKYSFKKDVPEYSDNSGSGSITVNVLPK